MFKEIFMMKIYRQKFVKLLCVFTMVIFVTIVILINFLLYSWKIDYYEKAQKAFNTVEERIRTTTSLIDISMSVVYSDVSLNKDLQDFTLSKSNEEYLFKRYITSSNSEREIASFTNEMNKVFNITSKYVLMVSIHYDGYVNYIETSQNNKEEQIDFNQLNYKFNVKEEEFNKYYDKDSSLVNSYPYTFKDENGITQKAEIVFWLDIKSVFEKISNYDIGAIYAVFNNNSKFVVIDTYNYDVSTLENWFEKLNLQNNQRGILVNDIINKVNFFKFDSSQIKFTCVSIIDEFSLFLNNLNIVLVLILLIIVISLIAFIFMVISLKYDAIFMKNIMFIIENIKNGKFVKSNISNKIKIDENSEPGIIIKELEKMSDALSDHIQKEYEFKIKQRESEMIALQYQINPHFLYNTLEEIRAQALISGDEITADCISNLGSLYREMVKKPSKITLGEEFDLLESYLKIMSLKYPKNFIYQFDVEQNTLSRNTVKFWMQPIVENFFVHGFDLNCEYNMIIVKSYYEGDFIIIEISDNGVNLKEEKVRELNYTIKNTKEITTSSIGLPNVYIRLKTFYLDGFDMDIKNNENQSGIKVTINIPVKNN